MFSPKILSMNAKGVVVEAVDVHNHFSNEQEFEISDHMLQWIRTKASKLEFGVVIGRFDNGSDIRCAFMKMTCERSEKYRPHLQNFKRDDTDS